MIQYGQELSEEQYAVVNNAKGAVLVLAGPGSGKTRTITYKLCKLIEDGAEPHSILLLTFTNKAAGEMKRRASLLIGQKAKEVVAGTFHHFAHRIIRKYASLIGLKSNFTILDEQDSTALLKKLIPRGKKIKPAEVAALISLAKLRMCTIQELLVNARTANVQEIVAVAAQYERVKRDSNCVDFDDLLFFAYKLLKENESVRKSFQERLTHLLVDEFQDTDKLQAAFLELLYSKDTKLFMVVGDEAQSIYSFRGAEVKNILEFKDKYNAQVFSLLTNYRSTDPIIDLINEAIKNSNETFRKTIRAASAIDEKAKPILVPAQDRKEEAWLMSERISNCIKNSERVGVLFRSTYHCSELELELTKRGITYELRGGVRFAEQRHIKDMLSIIRAIVNKKDSAAIERLLRLFPGIGEVKAVQLSERIVRSTSESFMGAIKTVYEVPQILASIEGKNAAALLNDFYERFYQGYMKREFEDYRDRIPDIETLIGAAAQYETVDEFLASCVLEPPEAKKEEPQLILSTIHQAKGLEWDTVFIIGLAEGMFPSQKATYLEEERRLFYVAASRAKKRLIMSYPVMSSRFYTWEEGMPSCFIQELPPRCYNLEMGNNTKTTADFIRADLLKEQL